MQKSLKSSLSSPHEHHYPDYGHSPDYGLNFTQNFDIWLHFSSQLSILPPFWKIPILVRTPYTGLATQIFDFLGTSDLHLITTTEPNPLAKPVPSRFVLLLKFTIPFSDQKLYSSTDLLSPYSPIHLFSFFSYFATVFRALHPLTFFQRITNP